MAFRGGRPNFTNFHNRRRDDRSGDRGESGGYRSQETGDNHGGYGGGQRGPHPRGLRGSQIGQFYANRRGGGHGSRRSGGEVHSRNWREDSSSQSQGDSTGRDGDGSGPSQRERRGKIARPPGLRGKEIGLFYAKLSRNRKDNDERKKLKWAPKVSVESAKLEQIKDLLATIPALTETAFPGPSSSTTTSTNTSSRKRTSPKPDPRHAQEQEDYENPSFWTRDGSSPVDSENVLNVKQEVDEEEFTTISYKKPKPDIKEERPKSGITVPTAGKYDHISDSVFKQNFLRSITENIDAKIERLLQSHSALERNSAIDQELKETLEYKQANSNAYKKMYEFRKKLPSYQMQDKILDLVKNNQVIVVSGETGCGKTTQVAQFILDDYIMRGEGSVCRVICTQPRRISATSVAERVAKERDEELGTLSVGYQIRLDKVLSPKQGSILYCTTGILLQWMQTDPSLSDCSHIVLDEIHERDTVCDFVITLLKDILPKRPDLKVILMSATLNAEHFSCYFGSCPCINIPGFTFPVEEFYLEDVLEMTRFEFEQGGPKRLRREYEEFIGPHIRNLEMSNKYSRQTIQSLRNSQSEEMNMKLIAELVQYICTNKPDGAILVFLPGWEQISDLNKALTSTREFRSSRYLIIPLHSMMPTTVQRSVFDRPPAGVRKIVIATNIAETSITIDDVVYVIDSGKIKMKKYDVQKNIETLQPEWVSVANARQRRGRAGRVQPGVCYHLYTRAREMTFDSYPLPEMLRSRLEDVILSIKIQQLGKVRPFLNRVMNPPDPLAVDHSLELLTLMNALDNEECLTPLGFHLAKLPVDPRAGKMLLMGALFSCVDPVFSAAASLSFKEAFQIPLGKEREVDRMKLELSQGSKSDHLLLADVLILWEEQEILRQGAAFCRSYFLSRNTLTMLRDLKKQFAKYVHDMKFLSSSDPKAHMSNINSSNRSLVKAIICAGLYPNVAYLHQNKKKKMRFSKRLSTHEDGAVYIHPKSVNDKEVDFESPLFVYHLKLKSKQVMLHDTTMIYPLPLIFFGESLRFFVEDGEDKVCVGKNYPFRCQESTAHIVMELRKHLHSILENMACNPGTINWQDRFNPNTCILRAISELITYEEDKGLALDARYCDVSGDEGDEAT